MKNIEQFIIEQEYDKYFLIEEGFWSWIKKLGKKFWKWLTDKDFTGDDVNWNVGKKKKIQWAPIEESEFDKLKENKGIAENFVRTLSSIERYDNLFIMQGFNSDKTPIIMMLFSTNKKFINKLFRHNKNYDSIKNKIEQINNPVTLITIEVSRKNTDSLDDLFDFYIEKELNNEILKQYDILFLNESTLRTFYKMILNGPFDVNGRMPIVDGMIEWESLKDNAEEDDDSSYAEDDEEENNVNIPPINKNEEDSFDLDYLSFAFITNPDRINKIISDNDLDVNYKYVVIDNISFIDTPDNKVKSLEKTITSRDFFDTIKNIAKTTNDDDVRICICLDPKDQEQKEMLIMLSNLSSDADGNMVMDYEDYTKGIYVYGIVDNITESLDVDNLFWMLDTWFANNEQEKTAFMSLIDNCIIKKTYTKNDLGKLCDHCNIEIRPFINFMCKDATTKGTNMDDNIDYYYELKKIIDALISNKATNNKYVRFS